MKITRVDTIVLNLPMVIDPRNGRIAVPQGPGLGVDPDPAVIGKLRSR